jgi:hypothetical protein
VNAVHAIGFDTAAETVDFGALWSTLPYDYLVKVIAKSNIQDTAVTRSPFPNHRSLAAALRCRYLRLSCLVASYGPLWGALFDPAWLKDSWALPYATSPLEGVGHVWTMMTPLRRDVDRRQALVELDVLVALMLRLTAEQLRAMYRTQFPVLRKYEHSMAFDVEGRKICKYHQSAGCRQSQLQARARAGELPKEWKNIWSLYEQWEEDPESVDWQGRFHPPFYRPDREAEITMAYKEFKRRLKAGEYDR